MAVTVASSTPGDGTDTGTEPSGATNGDLLIAYVVSDTGTVSGPSGGAWTKDVDFTWGPGPVRSTTWWAKRGASAPNLTWTTTGTIFNIEMARVTGQDATTPIDATGTSSNNAASTTPTSPSITTVTDAALLIVGMANDGDVSGTVPSGFTQDQPVASGASMGIAHLAQASHGASGTKQWTLSSSKASGTWTMAIRPTGGGGATVHGRRTLHGTGARMGSRGL